MTICHENQTYHDGVVLPGPELPGELVGGAEVGGVVAREVDLVRDLQRRRVLLHRRHVLVLE